MWEELIEAWSVNNRINLFLLERIDLPGLACTLSRRGGRDVARQFAHMHNNRIAHLKRWHPALTEGARLFASKEEPGPEELSGAFADSGERVKGYIEKASAGAPGVKTFRRGLVVAITYLIAHDSHHRGSILLTLKECGQKLDQETQEGIWDWERR
jgi:uncharacterized damage-inducible protein DinB